MLKYLKKIRDIVDEIRSFYTFYFKLNKADRDIVFYAEDRPSYTYFAGLIDCLTKEENLKICYVTSDRNDPLFSSCNENIKTIYINKLLFLFTITLNSKLLVMTMPDLHQLHVKRSERGTHHVYLFHNIGSSFPVIRFGALFFYDTVFCSGRHHVEEIRRQEEIYKLKKKNLVEFGYWRLEKIYDDYRQYHATHQTKPSEFKARILLGPSWGKQSILDLCGGRLIRILLDAGYEVIVRPHPMTRKTNPQLLDSLNKEFKGEPNYVFEDNIASVDSLFTSDILVCDWSGLTFEYAFGTERPVLFIDVPQKIVNERYKEVNIEPMDVGIRRRLGEVLGLEELEKAPVVIDRMLKAKDAYVNEIRAARAEYVYNFGSSSKAGADFIKRFIKKGGARQ